MNTGERTIEWLYRDQLRVDDKWAERLPNGFRWWADRHAQTVEVTGQQSVSDGDPVFVVSVQTELLRSLELDDRAVTLINGVLMSFASMAGPVYDPEKKVLSLCSLVRIHDGISGWMNPLVSLAAVLQIGEARIVGSELAQALNADEALSAHPLNGSRPQPDEMAEVIATLIAPSGQNPSRWSAAECQDAVDQHMNRPPALLATAGGPGFTVEFPFGEGSSLCQAMADQPHPRYGNGLLLLQSFPFPTETDIGGAKLALEMNIKELTQTPFGYGFGSYAFRDGTLHFTCFFPNAAHRPGMLPNIYLSCAERAREMALRLVGTEWTAESFGPTT